jgi:hypothetical protein
MLIAGTCFKRPTKIEKKVETEGRITTEKDRGDIHLKKGTAAM